MSEIVTIEGETIAGQARFALLATRFNAFIVDHLIGGARETLQRHGAVAEAIELIRVPGAYELPLAAQRLATGGRYDALIALGCVIRGATPHFEYVASACARGLSTISRQHDIPIAFGVLTTETQEQAIERSGSKAGNKGAEAALSAIEMVNLLAKLGG